MQAVIGSIQLARMPAWTEARRSNAAVIRDALAPFTGKDGPVRVPSVDNAGSVHAHYKFYAYVRPENLGEGWSRDRIVDEINAGGVPCFQGSCSEVYLEKAFDDTSARPSQRLPVARLLGETSLMWLVHPTLTIDQLALTAKVIGRVLRAARR